MTDIDLDEIRARAAAATPGPWYADKEIDGMYAGHKTVVRAGDPPPWSGVGLRVVSVGQTRTHLGPAEPNVEFIAHARTDVPALLAHVAELEAERDEARRERDEMAQRIAAEEADLDEIYAKMRAHETCPRCGGQLAQWECEFLTAQRTEEA